MDDDSQEKPSLADDPSLLSSMEALDRPLAATELKDGPHRVSTSESNEAQQDVSAGGPPRRGMDLFPSERGGQTEPSAPRQTAGAPDGVTQVQLIRRRRFASPHSDGRTSEASKPDAAGPDGVVDDTVTYERFYGLAQKPFSLSADPKFLYYSVSHEWAFQEMLGAIRRREGMVVLTGEVGTGKTTLCRGVLDQLDRHVLSAFVADPFMSVEDLLKTLLVDFGVVNRDGFASGRLTQITRHEMSTALRGFLRALAPLQAFAIAVFDEAQHLSNDVLEQIRILCDVDGETRLLQAVLVGQPELLDRLALPELRQLSQRLSLRCRVDPLTQEEVAPYVSHRLAVAGNRGGVEFDGDALARVYAVSRGVPRVINIVCDRALRAAHDAGATVIDKETIQEAVATPELEPPKQRAPWARWVVALLVALVLLAMGAGAIAFVYRDRLAHFIIR